MKSRVVIAAALLAGCSSGPGVQPMKATAEPGASRESLVNFTIQGTIKDVEDGDTITLLGAGGVRFVIRFSDIDTPETHHDRNPYASVRDAAGAPRYPHAHTPDAPGQKFGQAARTSLLEMAPVGSKARAECYEADQYGRMVCHVFVGGTNTNLEQIKRGWGMTPSRAEWVRDPASKPAEVVAKANRVGVWQLADPMNPSDWRKGCWQENKCEGFQN